MISYDAQDHKEFIQQQTMLICTVCGIDYTEITSENKLEIKSLLQSHLSGNELGAYTREVNSIVLANQLLQYVGAR